MNDGRVLIVNLRNCRIGDDGCNLLGSLAVSALQVTSQLERRLAVAS